MLLSWQNDHRDVISYASIKNQRCQPPRRKETNKTHVEVKCQLDATDDIYCRFYCLLNTKKQIMPNLQIAFSIFTAPNTIGSVHLYNTLELLMIGIMVPETCWANNKFCNKDQSVASSWLLFPRIKDDAWSNSYQGYGTTVIYPDGHCERRAKLLCKTVYITGTTYCVS